MLHLVVMKDFWQNVDIMGQDECWPWTGYSGDHRGYGRFWDTELKCRVGAHRIAWSFVNGEIPDGMHICHVCDNPPCCNPSHLFSGSAKDNSDDSVRKKRHFQLKKTHCLNGHEFDEKNTYIRKTKWGTGRSCNACRKIREKSYNRARK